MRHTKNNMDTISKLWKEFTSTKPKYTKGCVMLDFDFPEISGIHNSINPKDVYENPSDPTYGLEINPHTTLLYGLDEGITPREIKEALEGFVFGECVVHNILIFEKEDYDVLKFEVKGKDLHESNILLTQFPHENKFPDYNPHLTIAYLKPGTGQKYVSLFEGISYILLPTQISYSYPPSHKTDWKI